MTLYVLAELAASRYIGRQYDELNDDDRAVVNGLLSLGFLHQYQSGMLDAI